jgi:hypothetical protein
MKQEVMAKIDQMVFTQTGLIKTDVNVIEARMNALDFRLTQNFTDQEDIARRLQEIKQAQQSLHQRISKTAEKMNSVKSILASYHS